MPVSRRFRLRLKARDCETIDYILASTSLRTRSRVVRAALNFSHVYYSIFAQHLRVVLREGKTGEIRDFPIKDGDDAATDHGVSSPMFFELRLSPGDASVLNALKELTGIRSLSRIIRESLHKYRMAVRAQLEGFELGALSMSNEFLRVPLAIPSAGEHEPDTKTKSDSKKKPEKKRVRHVRVSLPDDVSRDLEQIAKSQGKSLQDAACGMLRKQITAWKKRGKKSSLHIEESALPGIDSFLDFHEDLSTRSGENQSGKEGFRRESDVDTSLLPVQPMLFPLPGCSGAEWALVLAQDELGRPQQQVVRPETVIPLPQEEFEQFLEEDFK